MDESLQDVFQGRPWSVGGVIRGLDSTIDDEGRPLGERRAPSDAKVGVQIVLKQCPYEDERLGKPMNVSALAQIARHFDGVLADLGAFASRRRGAPGWMALLPAIMDQLAAPATWMLRAGPGTTTVPAKHAAGHKLAAGFFGVLRSLIELEALGVERPISVPDFVGFVHERGVLVGASESCAGPPNMIQEATQALLHGVSPTGGPLARWRIEVSQLLTDQVALGLAWELYDRAVSTLLLVEEVGRDQMVARNGYMAKILDREIQRLREAGLVDRRNVSFERLVPPNESELRAALTTPPTQPDGDAVATLVELHGHDDGAVTLSDPSSLVPIARCFVEWLAILRLVKRALWRREMLLREALGRSVEGPVRLESTVFPRPRALRIFEAIIGHKVVCEPGPDPSLVLRNHNRSVGIELLSQTDR